jgi:hypothetical protein
MRDMESPSRTSQLMAPAADHGPCDEPVWWKEYIRAYQSEAAEGNRSFAGVINRFVSGRRQSGNCRLWVEQVRGWIMSDVSDAPDPGGIRATIQRGSGAIWNTSPALLPAVVVQLRGRAGMSVFTAEQHQRVISSCAGRQVGGRPMWFEICGCQVLNPAFSRAGAVEGLPRFRLAFDAVKLAGHRFGVRIRNLRYSRRQLGIHIAAG